MKLATLTEPMDAAVYGGKAARLSQCLGAGLPVPPGLAIAARDASRIAVGDLTVAERQALEARLLELGSVAVRSSAIGEDGANASFAGQHVSVLNVLGLDGVLAAIATVWSSARTDSARAYRARLGIEGDPEVAVLVQTLVPADVAGVLFTSDPLSGSDDRFVVEAAWGLGEAVVAGLVTPDRYLISREGAIVDCQAGEKDLAIRPVSNGGTREEPIEAAHVQVFTLERPTLAGIAQLGVACERLFGHGQDIEWAVANRTLYLLQCRPITTRPVSRDSHM
jgi:pyruvate,water dikinase